MYNIQHLLRLTPSTTPTPTRRLLYLLLFTGDLTTKYLINVNYIIELKSRMEYELVYNALKPCVMGCNSDAGTVYAL